ncbi:MAG TPA: SGNH/GDSL hydrolase family protein [Luteolibacter sp.]
MKTLLPNTLLLISAYCILASGFASAAPPKPVAKSKAGIELLAGKRVLVLGDSITEAGSYVSFMDYLLQKGNPEKTFDIVSVGLSAETTSGLKEKGSVRPCVHDRLESALSAVKPAVVIACYGMNDGIYQPYDTGRMKAFETGMTRLVTDCVNAGAKVALVTPPVYDYANNSGSPNFRPTNDVERAKQTDRVTYDEVLAKFAEWEVKHPPAGVVAVADLHTPMAAELAKRREKDSSFKFANDGIHPQELGHLFMALEILKGLGVATLEGTPEKILADIKADPLFPLVNKRRTLRTNAWMGYINSTRSKTAAEREATALQVKIDALRGKSAN